MMMKVNGGVCAAKGFQAAGVHCGIRKNKTKKDIALVLSDVRAAAAAVYTTNLVKGAPLKVTSAHLADGYAKAIICNSGNANTCNANGMEIAEGTSALVAQTFCMDSEDVVVASTGVIGQSMTLQPFEQSMSLLKQAMSRQGNEDAAEAIMTTDTVKKQVAYTFELGGALCTIGGMAKGSGMIHPNMATMLAFITSDCAISPQMLQKALSADVKKSFNMVSIDGDTSTNDMVTLLSNGLAGNAPIETEGEDFDEFCKALHAVTHDLCRMIAADGEGATRLIECIVTGADCEQTAVTVSKAVVCSSLVKAAIFGSDANWGRVLCAIGYSGAPVDVNKIDVQFASASGQVSVCKNGAGVNFSEDEAKRILLEKEIKIQVQLGMGDAEATAWGCDLTYDYVKINGDYRT